MVFLGDYIDRGTNDIRNIEIVLALKKRYPNNVVLMRGNHEDISVFSRYGFLNSLRNKFGPEEGSSLAESYSELFGLFPGVTVAANGLVAVHGGISRQEVRNLHGLRNNTSVLREIRWSDPNSSIEFFSDSRRGGGIYNFGRSAFDKFMSAIGARVMVRSHQAVGYESFFQGRLVTIFSSGTRSQEGAYDVSGPKFMVASLSEPIRSIIPEKHIKEVVY